jgi:hypothetical protein
LKRDWRSRTSGKLDVRKIFQKLFSFRQFNGSLSWSFAFAAEQKCRMGFLLILPNHEHAKYDKGLLTFISINKIAARLKKHSRCGEY